MIKRLKATGAIFVFVAGIAAAAVELAYPDLVTNCAECGKGPKDRKCAEGYDCVNEKCVKK